MAMIKSSKQLLMASFLVCAVFLVNGQNDAKTVEMPIRPRIAENYRMLNVAEVDNVVIRSFTLLRSIDDIGARVNLLENQLKGGGPDLGQMLNQFNECTSALSTLGSTPLELGDDIGKMLGNIKDLHVPILKVPLALKNLNEARKAVQYCILYAKYLTITAIPGLKQRIKPADQTANVKS